MTQPRNASSSRCITAGRYIAVLLLLALGGCKALAPVQQPGEGVNGTAASSPKPADFSTYFDMLDQLAPGDPARQDAVFAEVLTAAQSNPTAYNRLRYAIALGAAGRPTSNPIEARRLLTDLLAGQNDLRPQEVSLANAYLREFDARVALYADLARQQEEAARKLQSVDADSDRRYNALNMETQRLRKALADAERKLEAVAEMEHSLTRDQPPAPGQ